MRRSIFGFEDWLYGVLALVLAVFHQPGLIAVLLIQQDERLRVQGKKAE